MRLTTRTSFDGSSLLAINSEFKALHFCTAHRAQKAGWVDPGERRLRSLPRRAAARARMLGRSRASRRRT